MMVYHHAQFQRIFSLQQIVQEIKLLHMCKGLSFYEEEKQWIAFCKWAGCDLTNGNDGGAYCPNAGKSLSHRQKLSAALKGKKHSPERCRNISTAKLEKKHKDTEESKRKKSEASLNRTPEEKALIKAKIRATKERNGTWKPLV